MDKTKKECLSININEEKWKASFSKNLKNLALTNDVSYLKLASAIDVDIKTLDNYMKGKNIPNALTLLKIAKYFDVSIDFLVTGIQSDCQYSAETLRELTNLIANFDIKLNYPDNINKNYESVSITVSDPVLAPVITELCMTHEKDFKEHAEKIASSYGNMKVFDQHLVDYQTFCNMIEDRFLYDGLEEEIEACGLIAEIDEEIEERKVQWASMSIDDREEWWKNWLEEHGRIN